jgi:DNA-binding transcriptional ArsR family regulator
MNPESDLAWIASVIGDPARSRMLLALIDGRARTAKELAFLARVSAATASAHLGKLLESRLAAVEPQGRHRYFRLASPQVGQLVEALAIVAGDAAPPAAWRSRADGALATARTCYDHLAGRLGVALADALHAQGRLLFADGGGELTRSGRAFMASLGIDLDRVSTRRILCRPCLDWTERRHHLAGSVGAAPLRALPRSGLGPPGAGQPRPVDLGRRARAVRRPFRDRRCGSGGFRPTRGRVTVSAAPRPRCPGLARSPP